MKSVDYEKAMMLLEKGIARKYRTFEQNGVIVINLAPENQMDNDDFYGFIVPNKCAVKVTMKNNLWGFGHISKDNTIVDCGQIKFRIKRWEEMETKLEDYEKAMMLLEKGIAKKDHSFEQTGIILINLAPVAQMDNDDFCPYLQDPDNDDYWASIRPCDHVVEIFRLGNFVGLGNIRINDNIVECCEYKFRIKKWEEE